MIDYYSKRANEYEKIYSRNDPVRQKEQNKIKEKLISICTDKDVCEIACGTGYWTQFISENAKSITASDLSDEALKIAKQKKYYCPITFEKIDLNLLSNLNKKFNILAGNFIFSHFEKEKIDKTMTVLNNLLFDHSEIFFSDNCYIKGIGGELKKYDNDKNSYKIRTLEDGTKYEILKNYYNKSELINIFKKYGTVEELFYGNCYWYVHLKLNII